mmetsp:Transcript_11155/g.21378  ORF Transcript_11155/g.21378 Transcript_11155/m.21378 type:complete len:86 (+) Transcript_11155:304-561(+)
MITPAYRHDTSPRSQAHYPTGNSRKYVVAKTTLRLCFRSLFFSRAAKAMQSLHVNCGLVMRTAGHTWHPLLLRTNGGILRNNFVS